MELWPGYITSIRQHETQLLVCAEVTHKVMRDETILEILLRVRRDHREFQPEFQREVLGTTVLTKYNNKTYRIDDVDFDKKPTDTFDTKDGPISFIEYYQRVSANTLSFLLQKNLFVNYFFFCSAIISKSEMRISHCWCPRQRSVICVAAAKMSFCWCLNCAMPLASPTGCAMIFGKLGKNVN